MKVLSLFGEIIQPIVEKPTIHNRDYKRNRCSNCGAFPKIHKTRNGKYYLKCHGVVRIGAMKERPQSFGQ